MEEDGGGWKWMKVGGGAGHEIDGTLEIPCICMRKVSACTMIVYAAFLNAASTLSATS